MACACPADFGLLVKPEGVAEFLQRAREIGIIKDKGFPPSVEKWTQSFQHMRPFD